ncbi:hypothetical protein EGW08_016837 [Elysia chlorotica]|uniref:G-protein coupled receptors family 1 profile domain-containing protein n=1 Tax=Elysia chlorotica TaxID=188477 RepID=A0A3S1B3S7_ELYCH|nr:hypothetical protein EGW08_016837 [Elysia chlorotica]
MDALNASSSQELALVSVSREPISDEVISYLGFIFKLVVNPSLQLLGIVANVINMAVFYKMGLSDGVTQNFFILSFSDWLFSAFALVNSLTYILQAQVFGGREVHTEFVHNASYLAATFPQTFSLITTVVIAVIRCCCVAMPLRVKYLITARRQLAAILIFSASALFILLYAFTPIQVMYVHNARVNISLPMFMEIRWYTYTLFTNIFFYIGFIVVIICVIILTISLNRSTKFREKSSSGGGAGTSGTETSGQAKEGRKEARVVKTVVFLCVIFILCYTPTVIFTLFGTVEPEFSATGFFRNANAFFLILIVTAMMVNANVNIFVYYLYNSRYRAVFMSMFGEQEK